VLLRNARAHERFTIRHDDPEYGCRADPAGARYDRVVAADLPFDELGAPCHTNRGVATLMG